MRYKPGQKEETRQRIVNAAARSFKQGGFSGIGVDGLARAAGVTSGAFYGNFKSKEDAFGEAIRLGMEELGTAITQLKEKYGENWWTEFAKLYTSQKRTCDLADSCALQSLTPDIARSDDIIRSLFESELLKVAKLAANKKQDMDNTWANLAMLMGGVTLARAVKDEKLSSEIATAIRKAVIAAQATK